MAYDATTTSRNEGDPSQAEARCVTEGGADSAGLPQKDSDSTEPTVQHETGRQVNEPVTGES